MKLSQNTQPPVRHPLGWWKKTSFPATPPSKRVQFFSIFGWILSWGVVAVLAYSRLLPQRMNDSGQTYKWFVAAAFFPQVLTFQFGLALATIAIPAIVLRRWRLAGFASTFAMLCTVTSTGPVLPHAAVPISGTPWRLMDMNVKYHQGNNPSLVDQIHHFNPDVITVEDPTPAWDREAVAGLGTDYPYRILQPLWGEGLEVYSRFPLTGGRPRVRLDKIHRELRLELLIGGKPVVLYVMHPYSPRTPNRIVRNRVATCDLADEIAADTYPVVAAGDFNFTAETPNQKLMQSVGMSDAWLQSGFGRGSTWPVLPQWTSWLPGVRIDHVFLSGQLTCTGFGHGSFDGSDHLPIVADIAFRK